MTNNGLPKNDRRLQESRQFWNSEAAAFDDQPDHGLRDPQVLAAWTAFLKTSFPPNVASILDIGCGTGSISVVLAGLGYEVTGIDLSPEMIARAEAKAAASHYKIDFHVMDATYPQLPSQKFDAIVCRHLLWSLPDPDQVLERWTGLLNPGGRLLLIEGYWYTGAGLHSQEIIDALPDSLALVSVQSLSNQAELWGRQVDDERYAIVAPLRQI